MSVLLARSAPMGLVFRRGPNPWTQLIRWNTADDSFEQGQWFRGKIEADRSDLSPSGKRLIYFAKSYKRRNVAGGYKDTWTALSRPPYFAALALWPLGHTWFGGGLFIDEATIALNHSACETAHHPKHPPRGLRVVPTPMVFWERTVLSERMQRDGWILRETVKSGVKGLHPEKWEKPDLKLRRSLLLLDQYTSLVQHRPFYYAVVYRKTGEELVDFEADWADWDQQGRLVFAQEGKLWRAEFAARGRGVNFRELADFNSHRPDPKPAPVWATRWN